jgi:hypothetical protein
MRLFDGYINGRPLMDRDGSGVSALLGLDGFVVRRAAAGGVDGRVVAGGADPRGSGVVPGLRRVGDRARPPPRGGPGPADLDRPVVLVWAKRLWR